jgi:hypothetical protein
MAISFGGVDVMFRYGIKGIFCRQALFMHRPVRFAHFAALGYAQENPFDDGADGVRGGGAP